MGRSIAIFRYSEPEWQAVAASLRGPKESQIDPCWLRDKLEHIAQVHNDLSASDAPYLPAAPKIKAWSNVSSLIAKLHRAILTAQAHTLPPLPNPDGTFTEENPPPNLKSDLEELAWLAELNVDRLRYYLQDFAGKKNLTKSIMYNSIFELWTQQLQGELKTSRRASGGPPKGPLWDFFSAALRPVLGNELPSAESFRDLVKREIERRSEAVRRKGELARKKNSIHHLD